MNLLTVGSVAFDDIQTPRGRAEKVVGGAATYITRTASYFVENQWLVSVVGEDFPPEELNEMKEIGIDIEGVQIKKGEKSFFWAGVYHENMNRRDTLVTELNVLANFNPILPKAFQNAPYVILGNLTPAVQKKVLSQITNPDVFVALDTMNFWMDIALEELIEVISMVDVLCINEEEARQLSREYSLVQAAEVIHQMGPQFLIIKKGEHGALLFHEGNIFSFPALILKEIIDPTGAGDTFLGGFMGYLAKTNDVSFDNMKRAIVYGSVMASFCVEDFSLESLKNIKKEAIDARIGQFKALIHVEI